MLVDDVDVHGIAARFTEPPDGRFASASRRYRCAAVAGALHDDLATKPGNLPRTLFHGSGVWIDKFAPLGIVGLGQQLLDRHVDELRITVERLAVGIGELGTLDPRVQEVGVRWVEVLEIVAVQ